MPEVEPIVTAPAAVAGALRQATLIDRAGVSVRAGVIAAIPVAGMLALGTAVAPASEAVTMGVGAMLVGVAWRAGGPTKPPLGTMSLATVVLALCTLVGTLTGRWPWLHLLALLILCLAAGLATAIGRRGAVVGTQSLIAFIVFGRFPEPLDNAIGLAALVMAGGVAQLLFASIAATPLAWRSQRGALAAAYRQLAGVAGQLSGTTVPAGAALDAAAQALSAPALFGDQELAGLNSLVTEGRRLRLELMSLAASRSHIDRTHPERVTAGEAAVQQGLDLITALLNAIADAFDGDGDPAPIHAAADALRSWGEARDDLPSPELERHLAALGGQGRAAARLAEAVLAGQRASGLRGLLDRLGRPSLGSRESLRVVAADLRQIRDGAHLGAAPGRHAVRLAVVVAGTELLTQRLAIPRGYWAVVASATVLRPEFGATVTKGAERVVGTCVGAVFATLIAVAIDPTGWGVTAVVGILAVFTYASFPASFGIGIAGLTAIIVFLLHAVSPDSATVALDRGLDTVIGGAIGLGVYALWPTWSATTLQTTLVRLIDAQRTYLDAVSGRLLTGVATDLRPLARRARIAFGDAQAALDATSGEPARPGFSHDRDAAVLDALRRVVFAIHALRLSSRDGEPHPGLAELTAGVQQGCAVLHDLADAQARPGSRTAGATAHELPPLRGLYRSAYPDLSGGISVAFDELVDAINSAAAILGR